MNWWYDIDIIDLIRSTTKGVTNWSETAKHHDELRAEAVEQKDFMRAQFHKEMRDFSLQDDWEQEFDLRDANEIVLLLNDIEMHTVRWDEVYIEQYELMIEAGKYDDIDAAIFHQKLMQYAEEVFIDDCSYDIRIPGQTGEE